MEVYTRVLLPWHTDLLGEKDVLSRLRHRTIKRRHNENGYRKSITIVTCHISYYPRQPEQHQ